MFKNAAWAKAEQWSRQNPPPPVTPARRIFLRTGNFIASYWLLSAPLIVLFSAGFAALVVARRPKTPT